LGEAKDEQSTDDTAQKRAGECHLCENESSQCARPTGCHCNQKAEPKRTGVFVGVASDAQCLEHAVRFFAATTELRMEISLRHGSSEAKRLSIQLFPLVMD
jgi:hypothetical protein